MESHAARSALEHYLDAVGALDVYELRVSVQRLARPSAVLDPRLPS